MERAGPGAERYAKNNVFVSRAKPYPEPRLVKRYYNKYGEPMEPPRVEIPKHQRSTIIEEGCDRHGPRQTEHTTLLVDETELEGDKPQDGDAPPCPVHPQYSMLITEVDTKYGPAQLHYCPHQQCIVSCFGDLEARDKFMFEVARGLHFHYRQPRNTLVCFCNDTPALKLSKSEKNPDRLFMTCRHRQCKLFQWADEPPHKKLQDHWDWYDSK